MPVDGAANIARESRMRVLSPIVFGVVALVTIGIGLYLLTTLAASLTLRCERAGGSCTVTSARIRGSTTRTFAIGEVRQATVQETAEGGSGRTAYRVVIELNDGTVPVGDNYTPGREEKQATADDFNDFVGDPAAAGFVYSSAERTLYLIGLAILGVGGLFVGVTARQIVALRQGK
jgi:hypothetical protein